MTKKLLTEIKDRSFSIVLVSGGMLCCLSVFCIQDEYWAIVSVSNICEISADDTNPNEMDRTIDQTLTQCNMCCFIFHGHTLLSIFIFFYSFSHLISSNLLACLTAYAGSA